MPVPFFNLRIESTKRRKMELRTPHFFFHLRFSNALSLTVDNLAINNCSAINRPEQSENKGNTKKKGDTLSTRESALHESKRLIRLQQNPGIFHRVMPPLVQLDIFMLRGFRVSVVSPKMSHLGSYAVFLTLPRRTRSTRLAWDASSRGSAKFASQGNPPVHVKGFRSATTSSRLTVAVRHTTNKQAS
mmetsp:Transcript_32221/g.32481  ORF Transcript_32221/g.32481 Transcript_32221/m.32481 type:complete len:188 (-) Transcript_32221:193-756(-)